MQARCLNGIEAPVGDFLVGTELIRALRESEERRGIADGGVGPDGLEAEVLRVMDLCFRAIRIGDDIVAVGVSACR